MKTIKLTQGKVALVDDADYEYVAKFKWCAVRCGHHWYALCRRQIGGRAVYMHRLLMLEAKIVDHADRDGLNNQRSNLRIANHSTNRHNSTKRKGASRYKGVHKLKYRDLWQAAFKKDGKNVLRKYFKTEIEAARAYNEAAFKHAGEFARLNQIEL